MIRTIVTFLIGCVLGATAVLLYLQLSGQLAIRRAPTTTSATGTFVEHGPMPDAPRATVVVEDAAPLDTPPADVDLGPNTATTPPPPSIVTPAIAPAGTSASVPLPSAASTAPDSLVIPVSGIRREQLHDTFRDARTGHVHDALDILAPRGTPVLAAVDGTIRKLFTSREGGLTIYEFDETQSRSYYYAHLERYDQHVMEGLRVRRGEILGYVGTTGNAPANTPHLHFAIALLPPSHDWWRGQAINPYPELMAHGVTMR